MPPLSPNRWRAISPYLDEALEIPTEQRATWLASLRTQDAALAADLQTLLDEHEVVHKSHFLEHAILESGATLTQSLTGQVVGCLSTPRTDRAGGNR